MTNDFHQIGVIAGLTFRESRRRRLLWIGLGLGAAFIGLFGVGFFFAYREFTQESFVAGDPAIVRQFVDLFTISGLYVINFLVVMVTVLTTVGTISNEISSNTIHTIAAKPIRRWHIVAGKWLGHAAMITTYTALLAGGVLLSSFAVAGSLPQNPVGAVALLMLESLTVLSVTLFGSTLLPTLANGVVIFMLYGVAFVGGWVEQIGSIMGSQTATDLGIASSLLMPSEALWRYAASVMQQSGITAQISPFTATSQPTPAFLVYAAVYVVVLAVAAGWAFSRRDF